MLPRMLRFLGTAGLLNVLSISKASSSHLFSKPSAIAGRRHLGFIGTLPISGRELRTSSTDLTMRKKRKGGRGGKNAVGKLVKKGDLPSKICVVCDRPFTWRKKWERNWDEVTTCSKSCNAKRRAAKQGNKSREDSAVGLLDMGPDDMDDYESDSKGSEGQYFGEAKAEMDRRKHKEAVKAQKAARRAKRMGQDVESGRKPCDLCANRVDLLIRCTTDESRQYKMVCGKCWKDVSGGVTDGDADHPFYNYGGLWKNRAAGLKKRVGDGSGGKTKNRPSGCVEASTCINILTKTKV
mmetsp:Transcript_2545/g.4353  ORF Transcript_2545/g.4353 Transcript_2545/m.4353 type:complete len:295 (-) Transcript_2545:13-897(-)